jgi:hypothetical protein
MTMTVHGVGKARNKAQKLQDANSLSLEERVKTAMFAENFIDCFEPAIPHLYKIKVKLAVNAGASDTEILAEGVKRKCEDAGCPMNVAWLEGDDVSDKVAELANKVRNSNLLCTGGSSRSGGLSPSARRRI